MKVETRVKYHKYLLVYKSLNGEEPSNLTYQKSLTIFHKPFSLRNAEQGYLIIRKIKTELFRVSIINSGSVLWNQLIKHLHNQATDNLFKIDIKKYLKTSEQSIIKEKIVVVYTVFDVLYCMNLFDQLLFVCCSFQQLQFCVEGFREDQHVNQLCNPLEIMILLLLFIFFN